VQRDNLRKRVAEVLAIKEGEDGQTGSQ